MIEELANATANVDSFEELRTWGEVFSLEKATPELILDFYDVMDTSRYVVDQNPRMTSEDFLEQMVNCRPKMDLVIPDLVGLNEDCARVLRDTLLRGPEQDDIYYRFLFVGVSTRAVGSIHWEVLNLCTPIDLPTFVQRHQLISSTKAVLESVVEAQGPTMVSLKKTKELLDGEERQKAMDAKCVWHMGKDGEASCAIWKAKVNGKTWYVSNTHRCYQARPTLDGAIKAFHEVVKETS
jgi:hypothetical protein